MGRAEASLLVKAPIDAVWNCLNDIDHTPRWVVGLEAAEVETAGAYGLGSVYIDHNRLGPIPQRTAWKVTAFEPMSRQVHESTSSVLPSTMYLNLKPEANGTYLRMIVKYRFMPKLGPVSRAFERVVMNKLIKQVLQQNLTNLNAYL